MSFSTIAAASFRRYGAGDAPKERDIDIQEVIDIATTNGYTLPEESKLDALDVLISSLKSTGEFDKMDIFQVYAYNDIEAKEFSRICIKRKIPIVLVGNVAYTAYGFEGDGQSAYINTQFSFFTHALNYQRTSAHRGHVVYKPATIGSGIDGVIDTYRQMMINGVSVNQRINSSTNSSEIDFSGTGLKCLVRVDHTNVNGYNKNVKQSTTSSSQSSSQDNDPNPDYAVLRTAGGVSDVGVSFSFIGAKLTDAEVANIRQYLNKYLLDIELAEIA